MGWMGFVPGGEGNFGFQSNHHPAFKLHVVAAGDKRKFVNFETDAVADEADLVGAVSEEIVGKAKILGQSLGQVKDLTTFSVWPHGGNQFAVNVEQILVGSAKTFSGIVNAEHSR